MLAFVILALAVTMAFSLTTKMVVSAEGAATAETTTKKFSKKVKGTFEVEGNKITYNFKIANGFFFTRDKVWLTVSSEVEGYQYTGTVTFFDKKEGNRQVRTINYSSSIEEYKYKVVTEYNAARYAKIHFVVNKKVDNKLVEIGSVEETVYLKKVK